MTTSPLSPHLGFLRRLYKCRPRLLNRGGRWICNSTVADRISCLQLGANRPGLHEFKRALYIADSGHIASGGIADCDRLESVHLGYLARNGAVAR